MSTANAISTIETAANFSVAPRVSFPRVVRSEWRKFLSLRSLVITTGISLLIGLGLPALITFTMPSESDPSVTSHVALQASLQLQALILLAIGVLVMSTEFTKNAAITTFVTVPRRLMVFAAKALVVVGVVLANWAATVVAALGFGLLRSGNSAVTDDIAAVSGWAIVYLLFFALLGFALAAILRSSAGAITSGVGLIYVLPLPIMMLSSRFEWLGPVTEYMPLMLTNRLLTPAVFATSPVSRLTAALLLALYVAIVALIGAIFVKQRDIN